MLTASAAETRGRRGGDFEISTKCPFCRVYRRKSGFAGYKLSWVGSQNWNKTRGENGGQS